MERTLKKFKIDKSVFENFDELMSKHLDTVEELTISNIETNSKYFNIISLFTNIKTLIIEGNSKINIDSIILNLCKPYELNNLILNGTKLPTKVAMKKLINLKMISLNNIEYCNLKNFLDAVEKPDKIRAITLNSVCLSKNSINILKIFKSLEIINLIKIENNSLRDLEFLLEAKELRKINIENSIINFKDANILLSGKYKKEIILSLPSTKNSNINNSIEVDKNGEVSLTIDIADLDECLKYISFEKIDKILLMINNKVLIQNYASDLKKIKKSISITIKDVSYLDIEQAEFLKENLKIRFINLLDFDDVLHYNGEKNCYLIDRYIKLRECINSFISLVPAHSTEIEKFLEIYKILAENITNDEFFDENIENYNQLNAIKATNLENGLIEKQCNSAGLSEILKNCLACLNIESNIISGIYNNSENENSWNQVRIDNMWYNTDLALDSKELINKNILRKKAKYCLLNDKDFYITHKRKSGRVNFCKYTVNRRAINSFFRTGIFSTKVTKAYLYCAINSLKKMIYVNKTKKLSTGKEEKED